MFYISINLTDKGEFFKNLPYNYAKKKQNINTKKINIIDFIQISLILYVAKKIFTFLYFYLQS
jgi:hypothetical protein